MLLKPSDMKFGKANDNQEIDWEILTTTTLTSRPGVPAGIWATNQVFSSYWITMRILIVIGSFEQPLIPGTSPTYVTVPFTFDPSQDYHGKAHFLTLTSLF